MTDGVCDYTVCVLLAALVKENMVHRYYGRTLACFYPEFKGQSHRVMKCAAGMGMHVDLTASVSGSCMLSLPFQSFICVSRLIYVRLCCYIFMTLLV